MAQLIVRNLSEEVKERLKRRAGSHGRSLEAEVRDILCRAAAEPDVPARAPDAVSARLLREQANVGVTRDDVAELEANMSEIRRGWRNAKPDFER